MALHLIIDGYNLIRQSPYLSSVERQEFQKGRDVLVGRLIRYKSMKKHQITVIFDGWKGGKGQEKHDRVQGIEVIYSRLGETADEVIKRMVSEEGERAVVVTLDSDIASFALKKNATVVPPQEFEGRMAQALCGGAKDVENEEEDCVARKKGSARRLSRVQRRCRGKLNKL